jgi:hypothetical protein
MKRIEAINSVAASRESAAKAPLHINAALSRDAATRARRTLKPLVFLLAALALPGGSFAATPPPDKLLSGDTLGVFTIPDYAKAKAASSGWPSRQLWADPAMKPFVDKFVEKFKSDLLAPLERELGLKLSDYKDLAQGQLTIAVTQNGWDGKEEKLPGLLVLLDTKDKGDVLKTNLAALKKKWVDSGKEIKTEKIRDVEFTTFLLSTDDLSKTMEKAFPDPNGGNETLEPPKRKKPGKKWDLQIGQSDSLLILGSSTADIEKILIRQSGGSVPSLSEQASFAASYSAQFRDSLSYGWINLKAIMDPLLKQSGNDTGAPQNAMMPKPAKILGALGLTALQSLSFNVKDSGEGCLANFQLAVPEAERRGLFKILAAEPKDSNPPPFVPADAVKFTRWRLDLQKAWATIESMIGEISPGGAAGIKAMIDYAGKEKDQNFDLRKNLIANLGDDIITYAKNPRGQTLADLSSPPTLFLIGSPKAEQLAAALKALTSFMPQQAKMKEREFLGRKVYTMGLPGGAPAKRRGRAAEAKSLSYAASGGYVAISADVATLEEFLRGENNKTLRETPGLAEAAQKVGGLSTGLFSFSNDNEDIKSKLEILKKESGSLANLFSSTPLAGRLGMDDDDKKFKDWVDFSLLPSFDKISKYFYLTLMTGSANAQGLDFKIFTPNSPQFHK